MEKENDEMILKLPPIIQKRQEYNDVIQKNNESKLNDDVLTIPSIFSPVSNKNRHKSNLKDLKRGKAIEREKENRKLQQLLKGDRVYATREERVLKRWKQQQKEWNLMKRNIASKIGKKKKDLVITRAEEWREMIEEIDLMTKSIPSGSMSSNYWQHTLRQKTGLEETTHTVPVGNIFSGLYCNITENPRKPIKETIRKPSNNYINEPGKGPASKHWKKRSTIYQFRKKLHKKMTELKPNNLDHLDGLEIRGFNMFKIEKLEYPKYSYRQQTNEIDDVDNIMHNDKSEDIQLSESFEIINQENLPIIGPSLDFLPSNIILFNSSLYQEQTKVLEIKNNGTTAILLTFENVEQKFSKNAIFLYPTEQFSILPGQTKYIAFYFKPYKPGSYHLIINIESLPNVEQKSIELQGICRIQDEDKEHRQQFMKQIKEKQIEQDAASALYDMIQEIPESEMKTEQLPNLFCVRNRDHKLYWHSEIYNKLKVLSQTIIGKFRRRKRNSYKWDLSVSTLKTWLTELENIQSSEIIKVLNDELIEYIECAQRVPEPNPLYYDLCSNLITDFILQIPRFEWRSKDYAQTLHQAEQQKDNDENEEDEVDNDDQEWNVYETDDYHNKLYDQCKQYLCHVIDQFENSVIDNNQIDESVIDMIKCKLNPENHQIVTFGNWVNSNTDNDCMKTAEIQCLNEEYIDAIYSNSNITIMTSKYKTWICSNVQSLKLNPEKQAVPKHADNDENEEDEVDEIDELDELDDDDDDDEEVPSLNEFKLFSAFEGFNIVDIVFNNDMLNILTDTGDVYCSLLDDLSLNQKELIYNKDIVKISGCTVNDTYIALSKSGEIFQWNLIRKMPSSQNNQKKDKKTKDKDQSKEDEQKENAIEPIKISDVTQLTQIDLKIIDIAVTSTAYVAITDNHKLIIWGDYDKIYSTDTKNKKNKKSKKKKDKNIEESTKQYIFIETEYECKQIVSCLNNIIVLDMNGNLYSFGFDNKCGALGLGEKIAESLQPKLIKFDDDDTIITSISSWDYGCIAIDDKSNIWYWGKPFNDDNDSKTPFYSPTKIDISSKYQYIKMAMITSVGGFLWCQ